jgi:hypothetical protein
MNDGVKILLERMKTHPEEFVGRPRRWEYILEEYDNVLAEDEAKAIKEGLKELRRSEFTCVVMQEILREPIPVDMNTDKFTFNTADRAMWGTTTLELQEAQEQQQRTKLILEREVAKLNMGGLK